MDLLIPASGFATRMNNIPKFLLPINYSGTSLLETHIESSIDFYETIIISTRSELAPLLNNKKFGSKVRIIDRETRTMTETVLQLIEESLSDSYSIVMPDTFFRGESPHEFLSSVPSDLNLALWNIRDSQRGKLGQVEIKNNKVVNFEDKNLNCNFPYSWGALSFTNAFRSLLNDHMPHVGYAFKSALDHGIDIDFKVMEGQYFDCGTPAEYFELVRTSDN
jgi:NDP-sugar pyrophosphorylase family protein